MQATEWLPLLTVAAPMCFFYMRKSCRIYGGFFLRFLSSFTTKSISLTNTYNSLNTSISKENSMCSSFIRGNNLPHSSLAMCYMVSYMKNLCLYTFQSLILPFFYISSNSKQLCRIRRFSWQQSPFQNLYNQICE